eukprot:TRINITY_DN3547_c0_g1_i1.p2 TRINITY_DN3547_c0_g1~~TRINITY_DN3547_c0_g1_i1.p2  ORF type:complete len:350 (-),score=119.36 TRINITY_DN3547_c0_g1_i1:211-1260(-)
MIVIGEEVGWGESGRAGADGGGGGGGRGGGGGGGGGGGEEGGGEAYHPQHHPLVIAHHSSTPLAMIRRTARERREYLYRKSLEGKEREAYERKARLRKALAEGKPVPTDLKYEARQLADDALAEDDVTQQQRTHMDDEYARAGIEDPKIFITTSRDPSRKLMQFAKELKLLFPNSARVNRGKHGTGELVETCRSKGVTDLIIAHETGGKPDGLIVCHMPYGPTAYFGLHNVVTRHEVAADKMSEAYPHLIFHGFTTSLGDRVTSILKYLFPVPKDESRRVVSFVNDDDFISFRHHVYEKHGKEVALKEIGPRFELKLYHIKLGTFNQKSAETEWVLRPYMRTAYKRKAL